MIVSHSSHTSKRASSIRNQGKEYQFESGHSLNSQSRSSVFNRYGEEYSFNRQDTFCKDQPSPQARDRLVYRPAGLQEGQSLVSRNPQLIRKYESIYQQLQEIEGNQVLYLFLEQIEENEQNREKIASNQRAVRKLEQEIVELKLLLDKKRQAIRKLCETESNNLNLIQSMQLGNDKKINFENHYFSKYRELEAYINQYITNTNEAQEQFIKNYKIARNQNQRIIISYEKLQHELFACSKELQLKILKQSKLHQSQNLLKQREKTFIIQIQNLQEQNSSLRKSVQQLAQKLRTNEQFQVQLAKENRQLSSELDFIREKINQNQSLSRDIFEKMQSHSEMNQRLLKQKEQLQKIISDISSERDTVVKEKQQLLQNINIISADISNLKQNNLRLLEVINQKDSIIQQLEQQLKIMRHEEQQLLMEYQNEKQSKQSIKCQLLDLAEQVKFMQNTYQKQITKNGKIKDQLQRFWQKNGVPLKQISNESRNQSNSQSFKSSKGSMSRTFKEDQNNEYLF